MKPGDYAKVIGLNNLPELNGRHVEILTDLEEAELPETDGLVRKAFRHGIAFVTQPERTGYLAPENLTPIGPLTAAICRAIWLHETGHEPPQE